MHIGDKEVVMNESFIARDNEEIIFKKNISGTDFNIVLIFRPMQENETQSVTWTFVDQITRITCIGWNNTLGSVTKEPILMGKIKTIPLGFSISQSHVAGINAGNFILLLGGVYAE
jgi:hypothetical protein